MKTIIIVLFQKLEETSASELQHLRVINKSLKENFLFPAEVAKIY